jgi:YggT family protein
MTWPEVRAGVHLAIRLASLALILLVVVRLMVRPERFRFGTRSFRFRAGRASDFLVQPVHAALPPGTSSAVACVLAMVGVLLAAYFAMVLTDELLGAAQGVHLSLVQGESVAAFGYVLYAAVSIYTALLVVRILLSWVRVGPYGAGRFGRFLHDVTEPVLALFRGILPPLGMLDLSPLVVFFLLQILKGAIRAFFLRA